MARIRLQVIVVPVSHADVSPELLGASVVRRFLHLALEETTLAQLKDEISARFAKLYPEEDRLVILGLQDHSQCDLDPDFSVSDVFDSGDVIRVLTANDVHKHRMSYSEEVIFNGTKTPASQLKTTTTTTHSVIQSTPLSNPAPILTEMAEVPQDDNADEYFHTANHRLPTKKTAGKGNHSSAGSNGVKVKKVRASKPKAKAATAAAKDSAGTEHDDSNVSLPPPEEDTLQSRIIPKKRVAKPSFDLSGTSATPVAGKRVTSGMLNVPLHTQIHAEIIHGSSPKSATQQEVIISSEDLFDDDSMYDGLKVEYHNMYDDEDQAFEDGERSMKSSRSKLEGDTIDKEEVLNLFKNEGRNLQRLKRNLQIDMVDPPKFDGTRTPRAAAKKASSMLKDTHKPQVPNLNTTVKVESLDNQREPTTNGGMHSVLMANVENNSSAKESIGSQSTTLSSSVSLINVKPGKARKHIDSKLARIELAVQATDSETTKALYNVLEGYAKLEADPENFKPIEIIKDGREFIPAILLHASPNIVDFGPTEVSTNKRKRRTGNKASITQEVKPAPIIASPSSKNGHNSDESSSDSDGSESSASDSDDEADATHVNKKPRLVVVQPNRLTHAGVKPKVMTPAVSKTKPLATPVPSKNKAPIVETKNEAKLQTPATHTNGGATTKPLSTLATPSLLNSIKKPTLASLTSLQDLLKKGTPDVHDVNSPHPASVLKKTPVAALKDDLDSDSDGSSDNDSSSSSSSEDELMDSAKFITVKKVAKKTPKLKNRLSSLFSRK